ncbi:MAG TPA: hypothetical protein VHL85_00755 [Burkholderiales bacterium]|jgi:hypothetical protein|nr:hypothetical protein [Burkholderiales bacterium]
MLKLFGGGKPDHPMADAREARRILEQLPAQDPFKALEELAHWHESIGAAPGFRLDSRAALLLAIDDAAQPRVRKLAKDYLAATRPSRFQENRLWMHCHEYWRQAGAAFGRCVEGYAQDSKASDAARANLVPLVIRALRSLAQHIKWMHLRYGPVDPAAWAMLNRTYAFAEGRGLAATRAPGYAGLPESSPREEFLKAAMFSASSPDSLLPQEVVLAERLIGDLVAGFALAAAPAPELPYCIALDKPMAPARAARAGAGGGAERFLGGGSALAALQALIQKIEATGQVPASASLGEAYEPEMALDVMQHLAMYWSPIPPERRHPRHLVKSRLAVVQGFDGVVRALSGAAVEGAEAWIVENVSAGGFGAAVPQVRGDWLKIGALLAMQPEGGSNWVVGMIRRVNRVSGQQARVGIQTLSRAPLGAQFEVRGTGRVPGILLPSGEPGSAETAIALQPAVFVPGLNIECERGGRLYMYLPQGIVERGEDYEIGRFREMIRET